MSSALRYVAVTASIGALIFACGSSGDDSGFGIPNSDQPDGGDNSSSGTFVPPNNPEAGPPNCTKLTCADAKANCGPASDGCGGIIDCGSTCPVGQTCGGGGVPSQCGAPACTKRTCASLGVDCGDQGDGCGGLLHCGGCEAGTCGGGGPSKCGGGGSSSGSDGGACVPTKTACGPGDCGPQANGCGGIISCPTSCPVGQTCGGDPAKPGICGAPPCVKKTCGALNCGYIADGCGGVVNCWGASAVCPPGQTCGGGGTANTCGTSASCTGLCLQQQMCPGGGTTSIEGYVTSPNGVLPVPNAVVYVPNGAVAALTPGVQCETCATASGNPLVSTTTDANGHFLLPNMPVSTPGKVVNIPIVVQLGRWRKQLTVTTTACANTFVPSVVPSAPTTMQSPGAAAVARPAPDTATAALPRNKADGDIPLTAISTGAVDGLECVFRKMGVDDAEFTNGAGTGRIRLYQDDSPGPIPAGGACAGNCGSGGGSGNCKNSGSAACPMASTLYNASTELAKYDAVIFGCVGDQVDKPVTAQDNVLAYANSGGRVFATHYSYVWLYQQTTAAPASWQSTAKVWAPNSSSWDGSPTSITAFLDTSFPKGVLFSNWLQAPVAPKSATYVPPYPNVNALSSTAPPMVALTEARQDINPMTCAGGGNAGSACFVDGDCPGGTCVLGATSGIQSPAQRWIYTTAAGSTVTAPGSPPRDAPLHYTFNTDLSKPAAQQCGRVLYSDFHVSIGYTFNKVFPSECSNGALTSQEKVLAYMLFDLASCVSTSGPPACVAKSCLAQGLGCGLAGDGCGNQIDCGPCPVGQTCGGGGVPSQCGAPACTPKKCTAGMCGKLGDGCGGTLDCGTCATGTCGGGGANVCGASACVPTGCPAPAPGSVCGPVANGCGAVNNCPCQAGVPCVNGTCGAPPCTPRTCAQAGANCGQIADGCGNILNCGVCVAPQTCGGGGTANLCGGGVN